MYILYDFVFLIFAIVYLPYLVFTRRYHSRLIERLGVFGRDFYKNLTGKDVIWLHAVSVGEVMAASVFIKEFHTRFPGYRLLISTVTKTGNSVASGAKAKEDVLIYFPLDLSFIITRILKRLKVKLFIIMETEIWPNIITAFYKRNVPVVVMNARISGSSYASYKRIKIFLKTVFRKISLFCVQTEEYAKRLEVLGVSEGRIKVTGNMKYDVPANTAGGELGELRLSLGIKENEKLFVAGSTHRGEDEIIIQAYVHLVKSFSELKLLIAPRHIERVEEIEKIVLGHGLKCGRYSSSLKDEKIIVLDKIGVLKDLYALADIVFMGGSLFPNFGGHNLLEPAIFKKPILIGPYMANFKRMAAEFLGARAALKITDGRDIERACTELLNSPQKSQETGRRAFDIIEKNRGATARNIQHALEILAQVEVTVK